MQLQIDVERIESIQWIGAIYGEGNLFAHGRAVGYYKFAAASYHLTTG